METLRRSRSQAHVSRSRGTATAEPDASAEPARVTSTPAWAVPPQVLPRAFRGPMTAAYGLLIAESLLRLTLPLMIGMAINDLLSSSFRGLLVFAVGYLALTLTAAVGEMFRTRIFASLQVELEAERPAAGESAFAGPRSVSERTLALERTLPDALHTLISVGGALLLLGWYDLTLVPFGLLLIVPLGLLQAACEPRRSACVRQQQPQTVPGPLNDTDRRPQQLEAQGVYRVRRTDTAAIRTALAELFVLGMLASGIVHFLRSDATQPPAGDVFAVVCYLLLFAAGLRGACFSTLRQQTHGDWVYWSLCRGGGLSRNCR
jgi:hypothetical protein